MTSTRNPEPTSKGPSWAFVVNQNTATDFKLSYVKPRDLANRHIVKVPKEVVSEGSRKWECTLIGYFIGKKLPYTLVKAASSRMWTRLGLADMLAIVGEMNVSRYWKGVRGILEVNPFS